MVTVRSRFGGRGGGVVRSRGSLWAARASLRAAVTAAVAGGVCPGRVVGRWVRSAAGGGGGVELLERGEQLCGPWPVVLEAQLAAPAVECEPTGDVQQPVAQPFGLGLGELAVEQQRLGPDDQIVREQHDLQPQLVERERLERELRKARVLVVADAVLDMGALAVAALDDRGVLVGLSVRIAWKRKPSWSVKESCAPGCGRSRRTITREPCGQGLSSTLSVISETSPFSRSLPS